ncbi:hypothetical protein BDB00DRAFT_934144 [Zychaea mexicana]|uniref:uncharacterized protein n=1 Tax=Zychaea mexicana TaxID=64656 RepID=UPI0022FE4846|nr:uncharacterized protein BDB00DRAFT_934144 [Zychaea mexicana]KAI9477076.1 hypothetical protein BDB00DRAFT_934144 [Zychaea mexicana]
MRHLTKGTSKTIDIRLNEEKFYFPGETIKGVVTVHPKSPTKTNHITLRFTGEVYLSMKDKETITLFQKTETIAVSNDGSNKAHILDAKKHNFDFEFVVPDDLPSAMEFGKRKARIRYMLTAIHDRPMVPESLCSKAEYTVPILEFVDVQSPQYNKTQEQSLDFVIPQLVSKRHQQCQLRVSMPRFGFTRGDLVKLSIVFSHYESFTRKNAVRVDLVRTVDIRTARNTLGKQDILKSVEHDINIIGPYNFSQAINSQILIPTSTPPSIRYKDKVIDIHYKIRIRLFLEKKKAVESQCLEMPIVIGTWPKADVPIDDEDDDDYLDDDRLVSDEEEDYDDHNIRGDSDFSLPPPPPQPTQSKSSTTTYQQQHRRNMSSSMLSVGSASTVTLTLRNTHISEPGVVRSDSNASHSSRRSQGSVKSWRSSQSYEQRSPTLSRNTSASTNLTTPDPYYSSGGRNMIVTAGSQTYLNRSSSTPDLLNNPPLPPPAATPSGGSMYTMRPTATMTTPTTTTASNSSMNRTSYYDATGNYDYAQQQQYPRTPTYQQQYQSRLPSNDYSTTATTTTSNVPTHVLQPLAGTSSNLGYNNTNNIRPSINSTPSSKPRMAHRNYDYSYYDDLTDDSDLEHSNSQQLPLSSDSDDSEDEGDLLRIIEKKKKQAERARRARGHY